MKALNLHLIKLEVYPLHKLFKQVLAFTHQLLSLFLCHHTVLVDLRLLKVGEHNHKYLLLVPRNLY
jgi:hypothetical protein